MMHTLRFGCLLLLLAVQVKGQSTLSVGGEITLNKVAEGLSSPLEMVTANDGSKRLFVLEQKGAIRIIKNGKLLTEPFLNLSEKIIRLNPVYDERGLLGMVLHPNFKTNRKFYVYYSASAKGNNHKGVLAEYKAAATNADVAENTERILLEFAEPEMNHNGGKLAFGADGYLYIALGDGGGGGDQHGTIGNAQNLNTLLGKILRIDVDKGTPYSIPPDNPFVGKANCRPEIWAYGLRNPWKFSFDKKTNRLFCADVGQGKWEEVNSIEKGKNYGWRIMEGFHCFNPEKDCKREGLVLPITEYGHDEGKSVTGGYVYRGAAAPTWSGKYIFGDWTGPLFVLTEMPDKRWKRQTITIKNPPKDNLYVLSFGEDADGELYLLSSGGVGPGNKSGAVWKLKLE